MLSFRMASKLNEGASCSRGANVARNSPAQPDSDTTWSQTHLTKHVTVWHKPTVTLPEVKRV